MNIGHISLSNIKFACILFLGVSVSDSYALPQVKGSGSWSMTWENDALSLRSTDRHYTNGFSVSKTFDPVEQFDGTNSFSWFAAAAEYFPVGNKHRARKNTMLSFGQVMQTPNDISIETPDPNDMPYAGLLYFSHSLESYRANTADYFTLMLGLTGKLSLAEQAQKIVHQINGANPPQGWDNQIPTEPAFNLLYARLSEKSLFNSPYFNFLTYSEAQLGTIETSGLVGAGFSLHGADIDSLSLRTGRLSREAIILPHPTSQGFYFYAGISAKIQFWNLFLDGTFFHDSPSVDKELFVGSYSSSLGYAWLRSNFHFTWTVSTHTYEGQKGGYDHFGALNYSWRY